MAALLLDVGVLHIQSPCMAKGSPLPSSSSSSSSSSSVSSSALLANLERKRCGANSGSLNLSLRWSSPRLSVPLWRSSLNATPQRRDSSTVGDYIGSPEEEELFVANRNTTIDDEAVEVLVEKRVTDMAVVQNLEQELSGSISAIAFLVLNTAILWASGASAAMAMDGGTMLHLHSILQGVPLADIDPGTARIAITILGPLFAALNLLFIVRIVMSWYPQLPANKFPFVIAYVPTEPVLGPTRRLIPPVGGVDVAPVIWVAMMSFANEILLGQQGLLVLLSQQQP